MNTYEKYQKNLQDALAFLKDKTVYELLKHDLRYQISVDHHSTCEDSFLKIQNSLLPEQQAIISAYVDAIKENYAAVNDLTYIAGLKDMLIFLISYNFI